LTLLTLDKVSVRYGQLRALREVSFDLGKGETLFVTGPNGAGKSTLLKAIAGVVAVASGTLPPAHPRTSHAWAFPWFPKGAKSSVR